MTNHEEFVRLCRHQQLQQPCYNHWKRANSRKGSKLYAASENEKQEGEFDIEAARKQLESLLVSTDDAPSAITSSSNLSLLESLLSAKEENIELPPPPPLSTIERDRRDVEIQLLKGLEQSDEASKSLWTLWYSERGAPAKKKIEEADSLMGDPGSWKESEAILKELIDEYGLYFVEPLNRLATLYFLQSKLAESYKLCLIILKIKPWHFGALSGMVQVCIGRGDRAGARLWAEKRLPSSVAGQSFPPFSQDGPENPRRKEWVEGQVQKAEKLLQKAKKETKRSFGKPDTYFQDLEKGGEEEEDDSAWQ